MAVYDRGTSWQLNVNPVHGGKHRIIKNYPKSQYTREAVIEMERQLKAKIKLAQGKPATDTGRSATIGQLVDHYLLHSKNHDMPKTHRDKKTALLVHIAPFFGNMAIDGVPGLAFDQYIEKRKGEITSKAASTGGVRAINLELLALAAMSTWAVEERKATQKLRIPQLKYRRPVPHVWRPDEIQRLMECFGTRDKALYYCMYNGGLRKEEVCRLTWERVDFADRNLYVIGKGAKERVVAMSQTLFDALNAWKAELGERITHPDKRHHQSTHYRIAADAPVFPSKAGGGHLTDVRKPLQMALKKSGIEKRMYPHLLRHCFGTHALQHGADLRVVQTAMGHEQVTTTQIYTHVASKQLRDLAKGFDDVTT
jgi:integrase/recombinase XerD